MKTMVLIAMLASCSLAEVHVLRFTNRPLAALGAANPLPIVPPEHEVSGLHVTARDSAQESAALVIFLDSKGERHARLVALTRTGAGEWLNGWLTGVDVGTVQRVYLFSISTGEEPTITKYTCGAEFGRCAEAR